MLAAVSISIVTAKPRRPAEPSGSRTTARHDLIESEMIQHASRLFAERGFAGTHLQDIADAMGVTRTALYYYVKSKDDLLAKLVTEITEGAAAAIKAIAADDARDPATKVRDIARLIALRRADQPARFLLLVRSESELPAQLAKANETAKRDTLCQLTDVVDQGVTAGQFRPVDARTSALAIIGMCNWVAWWHHPNGGRPSGEVADQLADLAVAMVSRHGGSGPREPGPAAALALVRENLDYLERTIRLLTDP
jgi:AcrR family transcriptional regulator